jgi:peptidoglycan hydrolase-like protein with peptidoglycan-binding domain
VSIRLRVLQALAASVITSVAIAPLAFADDGPMTLDLSRDCPTMSQGATGECVRALQRDLDRLGASIDADGIFGPETERAVTRFQTRFNPADQLGVAGPQTRADVMSQIDAQRREAVDPNTGTNSFCDAVGAAGGKAGPFVSDVCKTLGDEGTAG